VAMPILAQQREVRGVLVEIEADPSRDITGALLEGHFHGTTVTGRTSRRQEATRVRHALGGLELLWTRASSQGDAPGHSRRGDRLQRLRAGLRVEATDAASADAGAGDTRVARGSKSGSKTGPR